MTTRAVPVRTCVGCRVRAAKSDLLRVVAVAGLGPAGAPPALVPDPRGRRPGRGAHLHPSLDCLALAERRRAFGRALRLPEPPDVALVREWVAARPAEAPPAEARPADARPTKST